MPKDRENITVAVTHRSYTTLVTATATTANVVF